MVCPFGVSWLCTLLLWGCICFPHQKGCNVAYGYSLSDDEFSNHASVLSPQTSNQFHSGETLNTNHDSVSPRDEMETMGHQSFVSLQQELLHHENNEDAGSATSLSEEMVQSKPDSGHEPDTFSPAPSARSQHKYEHEGSGNQHPFGLLVNKHTQNKTVEGITFPSIEAFKEFVETLKISFLTPGSDTSIHFQTAQEVMKNELASNAQNIKSEPDRSASVEDDNAHDDFGENEDQNEPMNAVFEQSVEGASYQEPSESHFVPVDSTSNFVSTSVYDNQDLGPGSALYQRPRSAATEHVSSNYGSFNNDGISGQNPDIFPSVAEVRNEDDGKSTSHKFPEQMPSDSFFGGDFSSTGPMTASLVNPSNNPSQDLIYFSSKMPINYKEDIQQTKYTSHGKDSLKPSATPANVLSAPNPLSPKSYGKSVYVSAPRGQHNIQDYVPKHRERPAPSFQPYQPTVGTESKDINTAPTVHLPGASDSVSSSSDNLSQQSSSGHVGVQTSSPHDAQNQALNRRQPVRSGQVLTVKPFSSLHGSSGYLGDQRVDVTHPSIPTGQEKDVERSDLSKQNVVSAIEEPNQMTDNTIVSISGGLDSIQNGLSSPVSVDYAGFNSPTNLAPTSASEMAFGNEVLSRNTGIKKMVLERFPTGDVDGARNFLGSFSTPQRRGVSLNVGHVGATRGSFPQISKQLTKVWERLANVNKEPGKLAYWPPKKLYAFKVPGSLKWWEKWFQRTKASS